MNLDFSHREYSFNLFSLELQSILMGSSEAYSKYLLALQTAGPSPRNNCHFIKVFPETSSFGAFAGKQ